MTREELVRRIEQAQRGRRPRRRRIKTAYLPRDTFAAFCIGESIRRDRAFVCVRWGFVRVVEMDKQSGNARYL